MIEIGPNLLVALEAFAWVVGAVCMMYFMYKMVHLS